MGKFYCLDNNVEKVLFKGELLIEVKELFIAHFAYTGKK